MSIPKERPHKEYDAEGRLIIDGSFLEGGGQILRISGALACILGIPIKVIKIRAGRSKPGLRPQHMAGLDLISRLCSGTLEGCQVGSCEVTFDPGQIGQGNFVADTHTAGSICLLMQAAVPCLLYSPASCTLVLKGGTNCDMAPQIDYTTMVFKPIAEKFGMQVDIDIKRRGYFPKGGGEVEVRSQPCTMLHPVVMSERGDLTRVYSRAWVAGTLPDHLSQKVSKSIARDLRQNLPGVSLQQDSLKEPQGTAWGNGVGCMIVAESSTGCLYGGSALGKPRQPAEDAAGLATREILQAVNSGACVDDYLQDQLVLLMALAEGESKVLLGPLTLHTETAIHMVRLMTDAEFTLEEVDASMGTSLLSCKGIGHHNPNMAKQS